MMKYKYIILGVFWFVLCNGCSHHITVIPVGVDRLDSTSRENKTLTRKLEFYLIKGYRNDAVSDRDIDRYVDGNNNKRFKYFEYHMIFIKESDISNLKTLQASLKINGKPIDNEDDWVFDYSWYDFGKTFDKVKSDSRKMPLNKNIKIENIPVAKDSIKK